MAHKRKRIFDGLYAQLEETDGNVVLFSARGEPSVIFEITNPVQQLCTDAQQYMLFHDVLSNILQTIGEGYALQKQDIMCRQAYHHDVPDDAEFLTRSYFRYFEGREFTEIRTFLILTQEAQKNQFIQYDPKRWGDFHSKVSKTDDILTEKHIRHRKLGKEEVSEYCHRFMAFQFRHGAFSMTNFKASDEYLRTGDRIIRSYPLVDIDEINLPSMVKPYTQVNINGYGIATDLLSFLTGVPYSDCVVFNQVIQIPGQRKLLRKLQAKAKRHGSMPDPSNRIAKADIEEVLDRLAVDSTMLVYCNFNILVSCPPDKVTPVTSFLETKLYECGIMPSRTAYNQLELFMDCFPGNGYAFNPDYDLFLTLSDAALCFFFKEHLKESEDTPLTTYYTDRQGLPVCIDITGKEGKKKMTDNANFFCIGPSGSGKSFHMNSVVRQLHEQGTDVVMVDTGNSYEGLCEYFDGKYISYTEERPITMNPFRINREEMNVEKTGFLKNLVLLIWKGTQGTVTKTEDRLIEHVITEYYDAYFNGFEGFTPQQREDLRKSLVIDDRNSSEKRHESERERAVRIEGIIDEIEGRRKELKVEELSFNSFYEYSVQRIPDICEENRITGIDLSTYRYMMKDFYLGGNHEKTLNENMDSSLFDETFVVFEIDSIKDDPLLFPLVTLIIMDVFLQKMRIKKNRKVLVIEEAWKAIASPLMAEYIKFMYKTARKFWASVGVVTQEIQDIIGSEIVKEAIINNSDVVMLLDQSKFKERFDTIKTILGLTDVDCKKIFTINRLENKEGRSFFREVFIRRGTTSGVYGVEEPRECYMTYTTERAEKEALKLYKRELQCSHQEAIEAYCRDWNTSGIGKALPFAQKVNEAGCVLNLTTKITS